MPMVSARGLTREFGARTAVEDVTFDLEPGQLCALLGPNGAGKTTTVRMLLGLIGPSRGTATVAGVDVPNDQARLAALRGRVGLLTETPGFYDRLSALENLTLFGRLYGMEGATLAARIAEYLDRLGLAACQRLIQQQHSRFGGRRPHLHPDAPGGLAERQVARRNAGTE